MVEIKAGIQKTKLKEIIRETDERGMTQTVMSAPSPKSNAPNANEIPHTGLISTNAMCFATIVVAWDISISHEHKLLCWFLGIVFVLLRSDQMFLMQQGSHEIAFSCSASTSRASQMLCIILDSFFNCKTECGTITGS